MSSISIIHQNRMKIRSGIELEQDNSSFQPMQDVTKESIKQNTEELSSLYKTLEEKMFSLRSKIIFPYTLITWSSALFMSLLAFKILSFFLDKNNNFFSFFIITSLLFLLFFYSSLSSWKQEKYAILDSDDKDLTLKSFAKYLKKKLAPKELLEANLINQQFKEKKEKTYQDFNFFITNSPLKNKSESELKNHSKIVDKYKKLLKEKDEVYVSFFDKKMIKLINNSLKD